MTNIQIAQAYAQGKKTGKSNSMFIENNVIYSYGYHFPIAVRQIADPNCYFFNKDRYSNTTARHKSHVLQAIGTTENVIIPCDTKTLLAIV